MDNKFLKEMNNSCFTHSDKIHVKECTSFRDALTGTWKDTKLSILFFSNENQKILQNGIRSGVYNKSNGNYVIGEQCYDQLNIIMRGMFLQYSTNGDKNLTEQVNYLNKLVFDYAIHQIYGEVQSYMQYKKDINSLVVPPANPIMTTSNNKQLIFKPPF
jgi:hypothetical protein